jgi:GDPmannose 4,6-dehydratase
MKSIVLGSNGQDGSYLVDILLEKGHEVYGLGRQKESLWHEERSNFKYLSFDLSNTNLFSKILHNLKPIEIYHVAAIHGSHGYDYESQWLQAHLVNTLSVHAVLEYMRQHSDLNTKLIYVSSTKVFDLKNNKIINEKSTKNNNGIYEITKNNSENIIRYYRDKYKVNANIIWTSNHESKRRKEGYFIPKIISILNNSINKQQVMKSKIESLDFWCDWGDAHEYMKIISDIHPSNSEDYLLATGNPVYAKELVDNLFRSYGLDYKQYIEFQSSNRGCQKFNFDNKKIKKLTLGGPKNNIYDVIKSIVGANFL